jgi:hypothetical protein
MNNPFYCLFSRFKSSEGEGVALFSHELRGRRVDRVYEVGYEVVTVREAAV